MKGLLKAILCCFFLGILANASAQTTANASTIRSYSPLGYWQTVDDVSGQPKALVKIWETTDHRLYGQIVKLYPRPGHEQDELCATCEGKYHNSPIKGMVIISDMQQREGKPFEWVNGNIYDPHNGRLYHCTLQLLKNGQLLNVRGYIGIPMFGRSQTWIRTVSPLS